MIPQPFTPIAFVVLLASCSGTTVGMADESVYTGKIKPLLRERCYSCHGALKQEAGLRVDTVSAMRKGGENGPVLNLETPEESLMLKRILTADEDDRMPPLHEGSPFSAAQADLLRQWITSGAAAPAQEVPEADPRDHWAFRPVKAAEIPLSVPEEWRHNAIDAFVAEQHLQHGLTAAAEAPPDVLVRRLYLDLLGLPYSSALTGKYPGEPLAGLTNAYLTEPTPANYTALADALLASPHHAERWARHWMDIWRYSDWWGLGDQLRNSQKHMWHWRDWIVESLRDNVPYDEMVRQMLAADELYPTDPKKLRATGFLARNYFLFNRNPWMEDTVEHVAKGFLGLTVNCAKCHDHKYEPISQNDYYALRAFFEPYHVRLDVVPGETDLEKNGLPRVYDGWNEVPTYRYIRGEEAKPDKSKVIAPGVPGILQFAALHASPVTLPAAAWQPEQNSWVAEAQLETARQKVRSAEKSRDENGSKSDLEKSTAEARVVLAQAELASLEKRIAAYQAEWKSGTVSAELVESAVRAEREVVVCQKRLAVWEAKVKLEKAAADKKAEVEKQLQQAREAREKALAAVSEPVKQTDRPAKLSGARWTATRFLDSTKDDPVVNFPPTSTGRRKALAEWVTHPQNPLPSRVAMNHLWLRHFGNPLVASVFDFGRKGAAPTHPKLLDWLAAEFVRSGYDLRHMHRLMVTSRVYRLASATAGQAENLARDPDNRHLWHRTPQRLEAQVVRDAVIFLTGEMDFTLGGPSVPPNKSAASNRRSLYFFQSNNQRDMFLETFDDAAVKECYQREQSIVPQQALALANSRLIADARGKISSVISKASGPSYPEFVQSAFRHILGCSPTQAESDACLRAIQGWLKEGGVESARQHLVWSLLNHHDFVTLR